jgi:hypothetical protein
MASDERTEEYVRAAKKQYAKDVRNAGGDLSILVKRTLAYGGIFLVFGGFLAVWAFAEWFAWAQVGPVPERTSFPTLDALQEAREERDIARGPYRWIGAALGLILWFSIAAVLIWNFGRYRGRWKYLMTWRRDLDHYGER